MTDDPVLLALRKRLQEGRSRMPSQTSEDAYAQQARSLGGTRATMTPAGDPLESAHVGGREACDELLQAEGGTLEAEEVARLLGCTHQAVDDQRREGKLLAVELEGSGHLYPSWQLTETSVLPGLERVLPLLKDAPPLAQMRFFLSGNHQLSGARPLDRLRTGEVKEVERAASSFGEQGAR